MITDQLDHSFRFSNVSIKMLTVQDFLLKFSTEKTKKRQATPPGIIVTTSLYIVRGYIANVLIKVTVHCTHLSQSNIFISQREISKTYT